MRLGFPETIANGRFGESWTPQAIALLRIVAGLLYLAHGTQKLFGYPAPSEFGTAPLASFMGLAGMLELVGGALIVIGLFTRPVAFLLAGMMAVAYFVVHAPAGLHPILNHGELAVLFCFVFLLFSVAGGGAWSLDRVLANRDAVQALRPGSAKRRGNKPVLQPDHSCIV